MAQLKRGCSAALIAELSGHFHNALLTKADWPTGVGYFHSGVGDLAWDGQTWTGLGQFTSWDIPEEGMGVATSDASVKIAVSIETMMATRTDIIRNLPITVYFATTTEAGGNVLSADPVQLFTGTYDTRSRSFRRDDEDNLMHDLTVGISMGPGALTSATVTHSAEDQIAKFPGDTAGEKVINANRELINPRPWPEP